MKLALSVRIAEPPRQKDVQAIALGELARLARQAGFEGLSIRASLVSVESSPAAVAEVRRALDAHQLEASMSTGDLALAANNQAAPASLRNIEPYLDLAAALGAPLVRVMLHEQADIEPARRAAELAHARGLTLCQQCHWGSLAETLEEAIALVAAVDHPAFKITYEPANLLACGHRPQGADIALLGDALRNVYFQNIVLDAQSPIRFASRRRGSIGVRFVSLLEAGDVDIDAIARALIGTDYRGWFTVHQPLLPGQEVAAAITEAGEFAHRIRHLQ